MAEFEIKSPKWSLVLYSVLLSIGLIALIVLTILLYLKILPWPCFAFIFVTLILIIPSIFCIYAYYKEKFYFKDGTYGYIKPFKKSNFAKLSEIDHVEIRTKGESIFITVVFIGKNGNDLIKFLDDGTAFIDGLFIKSLEINNIPYKYIGFNFNGN